MSGTIDIGGPVLYKHTGKIPLPNFIDDRTVTFVSIIKYDFYIFFYNRYCSGFSSGKYICVNT